MKHYQYTTIEGEPFIEPAEQMKILYGYCDDTEKEYKETFKSIPMAMLSEEHAKRHNYQSLKRLNERGGLSPREALANVLNLDYRSVKHNSNQAVITNLKRRAKDFFILWLGEPFEGTISEEDIEMKYEGYSDHIGWHLIEDDVYRAALSNEVNERLVRKVATLKAKEEFKGTPGEWHSVNYGGWIHIQDEPFYGGRDLLNEDKCNVAEYNGQLAASALNLLKACQLAILEFQLLPCKCDPKVIDELELAIKKALTIEL